MNQKELKKAQKRLRASLYLNGTLTPQETMLAQMLLKARFGDKIFKDLQYIKMPDTWNIKLHILYMSLNEVGTTVNKIKTYFNILAQEKHGAKHDWLREDVSNYFKDCIINNSDMPKVLFKSNSVQITVSFTKSRVEIIYFKTNEIYTKQIQLDDLVLFDNVKDMVNNKSKTDNDVLGL